MGKKEKGGREMSGRSAFEMFDAVEHPHQQEIENFARKNNEVSNVEYWFRAGWMARELSVGDQFIIVHKKDLNLDWYRKTKQKIQEEGI